MFKQFLLTTVSHFALRAADTTPREVYERAAHMVGRIGEIRYGKRKVRA